MITNIIGVISTDTTISGLYVDDTSAGRIPVTEAFYQESSVQAVLVEQAFNEALRKLRVSIEKRLTRNYSPARALIGHKSDYTSYLTASNIKFLAINSKLRGLTIMINSVKIYTESGIYAGQFSIYQDGAVVYTNLVDGSIVPFTQQTFNLDKDLFIVYDSELKPRNFKHTPCCGNPTPYKSLINVGSGSVDSISDLEYMNCVYTQGIEIEAYLDCDGFKFLDELDYEKSVFGIVFAKLVQQVARYNLGYWIITNNKVTPYSMVNAEELTVILEYLKNDIETMLNYLPENYDHSDCYVCSGMYKSEIII